MCHQLHVVCLCTSHTIHIKCKNTQSTLLVKPLSSLKFPLSLFTPPSLEYWRISLLHVIQIYDKVTAVPRCDNFKQLTLTELPHFQLEPNHVEQKGK